MTSAALKINGQAQPFGVVSAGAASMLPAVPFSLAATHSRRTLRRARRAAPSGELTVYEFGFPAPSMRRSVTSLVYRPGTFTTDMPVVMVMHGVSRNAWGYLRSWMKLAGEKGFVLIIPEFARDSWPTSREYNRGNVRDRDGRIVPAAEWSFTAVETIFDAVCFRYGLTAQDYRIYGHSAGAQFVHRLMLHTGGARIIAAAAANAGWYMMPDRTVRFPYGVADLDVDHEMLSSALNTPLTILLGDRDDEPDSPNLRVSRRAMAQGPHRLARGLSFIATAQETAKSIGCEMQWNAEIVNDVGHSNRAIAPCACAALFRDTLVT